MFPNTNFPGAKKYWYMGKFYGWNAAALHPATHALHYGTSVFEGIRAYATKKGPAVFRLQEHVDRLMFSASSVKMKPPFGKEEIARFIRETILENGVQACYIRPLLFYSYGNLGLIPKASPVELLIAVWEWGAYLGESAGRGAHVYIVPWRRVHHTQFHMGAKLGGLYIQSTISGLEAREHGADEAVFLNFEGRVAEGPGENIFIVKGKTLRTNSGEESILEGITRTSLIEIARDRGYRVEIGRISKEDFLTADEAFFSGTAVEVTPIVKVTDGSIRGQSLEAVTLGAGVPGPVTLELSRAYRDIVAGKDPKYEKWLTYVKR
jgi:branched-chain amino acid aminotransferase